MGNVTEIQVNPSQMLQSAENMMKAVSKADGAIGRMEELTKGMKTCFCGLAGDVFFREMIKTLEKWRTEMDFLKDHITDLREIAEEYKKTEGENKNAATGN